MSHSAFECGLDLVRRARPPRTVGPWHPAFPEAAEAEGRVRPARGWSPEEAAGRPVLFDEAELARALAAACADTRRELVAAFAAEEERRLSRAVEAVRAGLERAMAELAAALAESRGALVELLATALRRAVPALLARLEEAEVRRVLEGWSRRVLPEEVLVVRVRPEVRDALAAGAAAGGTRFEFVADPALPPGGVVLELPQGCARHDPARLVEGLVAALAGLLDDRGGPGEDAAAVRAKEEREP